MSLLSVLMDNRSRSPLRIRRLFSPCIFSFAIHFFWPARGNKWTSLNHCTSFSTADWKHRQINETPLILNKTHTISNNDWPGHLHPRQLQPMDGDYHIVVINVVCVSHPMPAPVFKMRVLHHCPHSACASPNVLPVVSEYAYTPPLPCHAVPRAFHQWKFTPPVLKIEYG